MTAGRSPTICLTSEVREGGEGRGGEERDEEESKQAAVANSEAPRNGCYVPQCDVCVCALAQSQPCVKVVHVS